MSAQSGTQGPEFDAIIISHPHFDHTAHLEYLHNEIPIYLGETAKTILDSTRETTTSFFYTETTKEKRDGRSLSRTASTHSGPGEDNDRGH